MKIGIDAHAATGCKSGLGVYSARLTEAIAALPVGREIHYLGRGATGNWSTPRRLCWENVELPWLAARERLDLLHVPAFSPPVLKTCRLVVTVHDLIGMLYPNQMAAASRLYWGKWLPFAVKQADRIIADSEHTKRDIVKHLNYPEGKIRVIYASGHEGFAVLNGRANEDLKTRLGIRERYFLCVGTIEPRKNIARVIEAFSFFLKKAREEHFQLVVVGARDFAHGKAFKTLRGQEFREEDVIFTGYLPHEELNRLYCGATDFVFPSHYEGFGMPVLEAMASGTAVITSKASSLPEVAGDAACFVDPASTAQIADAMDELANRPARRAELIEKGKRQIEKFSWKRTAEQTLNVYKELA